jgi:hypothetical protein
MKFVNFLRVYDDYLNTAQDEEQKYDPYGTLTPDQLTSLSHDINSTLKLSKLNENGDEPPQVPPRRKHSSGKFVKKQQQQQQDTQSLISNSTDTLKINGLPPTPNVKMGAGLAKIFDQCPLVIHCACNWIHPDTKEQLVLFGSDLGIYSFNLYKHHSGGDSTLDLVIKFFSLNKSFFIHF